MGSHCLKEPGRDKPVSVIPELESLTLSLSFLALVDVLTPAISLRFQPVLHIFYNLNNIPRGLIVK